MSPLKRLVVIVFSMVFVGCATTEQEMRNPDAFPPDIPRSAVLVQTGGGRQMFHSVDAGRVYVFDADDSRVMFTTHIEPGQRLFVEPALDRGTIDGKVIYDKNLARKHTHRIYFDPVDRAATSQPTRQPGF